MNPHLLNGVRHNNHRPEQQTAGQWASLQNLVENLADPGSAGTIHKPATSTYTQFHIHNNNNTRLAAFCPGLLGEPVAERQNQSGFTGARDSEVSGSGNSRAICKSAPHPRQITMPALHHSSFYRPNALPRVRTDSKILFPGLSRTCKFRPNSMVFQDSQNSFSTTFRDKFGS